MQLIKAINSGLMFKRPVHKYWIYESHGLFYFHSSTGDAELYSFTKNDLLADDWIVKDNWTENIYKTGVLCWVWDDDYKRKRPAVATIYDHGDEYSFQDVEGNWWKHATPIKCNDPLIYKEIETAPRVCDTY